jgi:hypothetical protein
MTQQDHSPVHHTIETETTLPGGVLLTVTPQDGRLLAERLAGPPPDDAETQEMRQFFRLTVAVEFATIAAANGYWRP